MRVLIYGGKGWIGGQVCRLLEEHAIELRVSDVRADDEAGVREELEAWVPTHVLCMVGRTHGAGVNTIDYLEKPGKLVENVRDNLMAPVHLAIVCAQRGVHLTYLGTGCIYSASKPEESLYDEEAKPDFFGSSYSIVKGFTDRLMHLFEGSVLNVRIRMPIVDVHHPRNFISKILAYDKICSIPNSMTVLPELLPLMVDMMKRGVTGTVNLVNPGVVSHNEILEMYRELVDPGLTWKNFSIEEQDQVLLSKRSNNQLDTRKLVEMYPSVRHIREAVRGCIARL